MTTIKKSNLVKLIKEVILKEEATAPYFKPTSLHNDFIEKTEKIGWHWKSYGDWGIATTERNILPCCILENNYMDVHICGYKVKRYDKLKELELRKMVKDILDNTTDDEKIENLLRAEKYKKTEEKKPIKKIKELIPREGLKPIKDFYSEDEINVKEGDILNHKKYGKGIVTSITGNLFLIDFDSGTMLMTYNPNHYI